MTHVDLIDPNVATGDRGALIAEINAAFGTTPAMFRAAANSTAALRSMWGSFGALGNGVLPAQLTEQIAVAIADRNRCSYCLSAHTALGRKAGVSREQLAAAQTGRSDDPRTAAVLRFALAIVEERGAVSADVITSVRDAGVSDEEIVEVIAHVALNLFTNYLNVALDVPVDFPSVQLTQTSV
jgi:uncharacterized peroxidase-related enzyme